MIDTKPKESVFVLMPFAEEFNDIYKFGIKNACLEENFFCERVDEQIFNESILERIYNQIHKSDLIVADMSHKNPNVFYEVGYSHAIGKKVILLTQNSDDIPFDLKHFPHIIYKGNISLLNEELRKRLNWFKNQGKKSLEKINFPFEAHMFGKRIENGVEFEVKPTGYGNLVELKVDIYNSSSKYQNHDFKIGLDIPLKMTTFDKAVNVIETNKGVISLFSMESEFYPKDWNSKTFKLEMENQTEEIVCSCKLIIMTKYERLIYDFNLKILSWIDSLDQL